MWHEPRLPRFSGRALAHACPADHPVCRRPARQGAVLQTAKAQVGLGSVTCGDARGLDRRLRCVPRMSHAPRIGPGTWTISLGSIPIHVGMAADQPDGATVGVRDRPLVTLANRTLIARCSSSDLGGSVRSVPCSSPVLLVAARSWPWPPCPGSRSDRAAAWPGHGGLGRDHRAARRTTPAWNIVGAAVCLTRTDVGAGIRCSCVTAAPRRGVWRVASAAPTVGPCTYTASRYIPSP